MASPSEIAALEIRITGVEKAISQFSNFQQTTTKTMSASEAAVTRSLKNMVAQFVGVAAVARSVQNVVSSGIGFDRFVEDTTTSFAVMMKSAEKAKQQMKDLYDFAVASPLTFKETAASSKQLMAYGFTAEQLIPTMKTLGSVAIATGHSLDDISYVYGTLKSQGRAYSRDLMQFGMRGIPIYEELAKVMNVNVNQIQKMASEGRIGFAEVEKAFQNMTINGGRFAGIIEEYMSTLTGKLSMLSDIAQQSAGNLMSGVTKELGNIVSDLTKKFSDPAMKLFISNMANDLQNLMKVLRVLINFAVDHIEQIKFLLEAWIAKKTISSGLKGIKGVLDTVGKSIQVVGTSAAVSSKAGQHLIDTFKKFGIGGGFVAITRSLGNSNTALGRFGDTAVSVLSKLASPIAIILELLGAFAVALKIQNDEWKKSAISAKSAADDTIRMAQFMKDYSSASEKAHGSLWQYMKNIVGLNKELTSVNPANVTKLAEEYNLSTQAVADALIYQGLLTQEAWKTYQAVNATKDAQAGKKQAMTAKDYVNTSPMASTLQAVGLSTDKLAEDALRAIGMSDLVDDFESGIQVAIETAFKAVATIGEPSLKKKEQDILANLTASGASTDFIANLAGLGVNSDALESQTKAALTKRVATLTQYVTDLLARDEEVKKTYTDQMNSLIAQGLSTEDAKKQLGALDQNPQLLAWLVKQLNAAQFQLDGLSNKTGKATTAAKELGKWWAPIVQAAKVSIDPIDDITVATQQASEAAAKEFNDRQKNYDELIKQAKTKAKTEQDAIRYMQMKSSEAALYLQYQKDITAEGEKQKNLKLYEMATEGNSAVMDQWKAASGAAYAKGGLSGNIEGAAIQSATQTVSGTQVGAMLTGGNPLAGAASALVDFMKSITNVNAVLNPFTTIFEAMRSTLEPIVNNVLQPMVDYLQMLGEAIAPIISVLVALLKPAIDLFYLSLAPAIARLQILAAGFMWFYNSVIVTVANCIVNIVNAIIKVLNKIPFVHIRYIDSLEKMTTATKDYTAMLGNQKSALNDTISYLTKKINDSVDKQIDSYQKLYEVGAITATDYEKQVESLNKQKIDESDALISAADKQLTNTTDIYNRLAELYSLKDVITNTKNLTEEQLSKLLTQYGIGSTSIESSMYTAVLAALKEYKAATSTTSDTNSNSNSSSGISLAQIEGMLSNSTYGEADKINPLIKTLSKDDLTKLQEYMKLSDADVQDMIERGGSVSDLAGAVSLTASMMEVDWSKVFNFTHFASGTSNIPRDMPAQVHKGEGIIPATFMDSIRSGELTLGSSNQNEGSGQTVVVNVTVQGSVQTEKDLATSIANQMFLQRKSGVLTA